MINELLRFIIVIKKAYVMLTDVKFGYSDHKSSVILDYITKITYRQYILTIT